jgi:hypothetical protein
MVTKIYAWPPVGVASALWTIEDPVSRSISWPTGARRTSSALRRRRLASMQVAARSGNGAAAGMMEALKRYLRGGVHLVRLTSYPVNYGGAPMDDPDRGSVPLIWRADLVPLDWLAEGDELLWASGTLLSGVPGLVDHVPTMTVTGLPPNRKVARAGEFARVGAAAAMIAIDAVSNGDGIAVLRLTDPLPEGVVSIGESETAIFEATEMGSTARPARGDWFLGWRFREVFPDEVAGEMVEVDPWT